MNAFFNRLPVLALLLVVCTQGCNSPSSENPLPRIAIAGLGIESSTFSPATTEEPAFFARTGDSVFTRYPFLHPDSADRRRAQWFPALVGKALPGGTVTRKAYESLVAQSLSGRRATVAG